MNKNIKAYDFMGYAKRKDIFENCTKLPLAPAPADSRFELPQNLCPLVSTKHRRIPDISIGTYSPRVFFTDKIKDYPSCSFGPKPNKPLTHTMAPKEGKMPVDTATAAPMAKLFAKNYGYKVCTVKNERFGSEQRKKASENPLF